MHNLNMKVTKFNRVITKCLEDTYGDPIHSTLNVFMEPNVSIWVER